MKNFIYLSILLVTLSSTSCSNQDDMVQLNDSSPSVATNVSSQGNENSTTYTAFDSSSVAQGDPTLPPRD